MREIQTTLFKKEIDVTITRKWEMPNSNTFDIKCIRAFIDSFHNKDLLSIDPFANKNRIAKITNDIDPQYGCEFNLDAKEFLQTFPDKSVDMVLFDPPYSPRQVSEFYKKVGRTVNMQTTQASFWGDLKKEIGRVVVHGGCVLSFGWNSGGVGKKYGFELTDILMVAHGGWHNDTICTAEIKVA